MPLLFREQYHLFRSYKVSFSYYVLYTCLAINKSHHDVYKSVLIPSFHLQQLSLPTGELKEMLGDAEKEQMKKDMAVQEAVTILADAAKEVEKTEE